MRVKEPTIAGFSRAVRRKSTLVDFQLVRSHLYEPQYIQQTMTTARDAPLIGVLALQGAFEEHQHCLEAAGCRTVQVCSLCGPFAVTSLDTILLHVMMQHVNPRFQ